MKGRYRERWTKTLPFICSETCSFYWGTHPMYQNTVCLDHRWCNVFWCQHVLELKTRSSFVNIFFSLISKMYCSFVLELPCQFFLTVLSSVCCWSPDRRRTLLNMFQGSHILSVTACIAWTTQNYWNWLNLLYLLGIIFLQNAQTIKVTYQNLTRICKSIQI